MLGASLFNVQFISIKVLAISFSSLSTSAINREKSGNNSEQFSKCEGNNINLKK
jgi:hypothetical protein